MRRLAALLLLGAATLALAAGCNEEPAPVGDECQQARAVFTKCGVTVPLLSEGACIGVARMVSRCVAHHATTCDELSTLLGRIDMCAADELDGGDLAPVSDLPVAPPVDASLHAVDADASLPAVDAPDAGADAGPNPFADASRDAVARD